MISSPVIKSVKEQEKSLKPFVNIKIFLAAPGHPLKYLNDNNYKFAS